MRVVGGLYRHRLLEWPDDEINIRPTKDRIREAIFSSLGDLTNKVVLDLYSGSGAMGIEAISRNAKSCTFVDNNKVALSTTKKNIDNLKINNAEIISGNDFDVLEGFINKKQFDLIILDPPYQKGRYIELLDYIIDKKLISKSGVFVIESQSNLDYEKYNFSKVKRFHYGEINVDILYL